MYSIGRLAPALLYFHLGSGAATHHTTGIPPCTRECIGVLAHVSPAPDGWGVGGGGGVCGAAWKGREGSAGWRQQAPLYHQWPVAGGPTCQLDEYSWLDTFTLV